jgi:hypothetical protein
VREPFTAGAWVWLYTYVQRNGLVWYRPLGQIGAWAYYCTLDQWPTLEPARRGVQLGQIGRG